MTGTSRQSGKSQDAGQSTTEKWYSTHGGATITGVTNITTLLQDTEKQSFSLLYIIIISLTSLLFIALFPTLFLCYKKRRAFIVQKKQTLDYIPMQKPETHSDAV